MLSESIVIQKPVARVYAAFRDLDYWCRVLPDVLRVECLYDDGAHQEFLMTVLRPNGPETVRGARFCQHDRQIDLVQPEPPPGFSRMVGCWRFDSDGSGGTRVSAQRWFTLEKSVGSDADANTAHMLGRYLRTNLEHFRDGLQAQP